MSTQIHEPWQEQLEIFYFHLRQNIFCHRCWYRPSEPQGAQCHLAGCKLFHLCRNLSNKVDNLRMQPPLPWCLSVTQKIIHSMIQTSWHGSPADLGGNHSRLGRTAINYRQLTCHLRCLPRFKVQGFFICHIINYTWYNQKWNVDQIRSAQWTVQRIKII